MKDVEKKREALKGVYRNAAWRLRVNKMTDAQVIAIYLSLKKQSKV